MQNLADLADLAVLARTSAQLWLLNLKNDVLQLFTKLILNDDK